MPSRPLLSICIPTYSRADLLDACLASILPQIEPYAESVECVISDNHSTDHTVEVIEKYAEKYSIRVHRNESNIGILANIVQTAASLAQGRFVWLLGDDDILCERAVKQVVEFLQHHSDIPLLALNVGFLPGDQRPNAQGAFAGVSDTPATTLRQSTSDAVVAFDDLFEGPCADLTAMYSVVLRQSLWHEKFPELFQGEAFVDVRSTYPHAFVIATSVPGSNVGLISTPIVMIYEFASEDFSWASHHSLVAVIHCTALLKLYQKHGVDRKKLAPYFRYQLTNRAVDLGHLIWNPKSRGGWRQSLRFIAMMWTYPWLLFKAFCIASANEHAPKWLSAVFQAILRHRSAK